VEGEIVLSPMFFHPIHLIVCAVLARRCAPRPIEL
jgi:predicted Na+-dependent transporter